MFDTAAFEREPVTPLHTTPLRVAMPASVPVLDQRVSSPVSAPAPPGDWRLEMRREMQDLMKESMREMMAAMPRVCNPVEDRCSLETGQPDAQGPQSIRRAGNTVTPSGTGQLVQGPLAPAVTQQPCNSADTVGTGLHGAQGTMATANSQNTRNAVTSVGTGLHGAQDPIATAICDSTGNLVTVRGTGPLRAQGPLAGAPRGATLGYNDPPALRRTFDEPEQPRAPFIHPGEVEAEHDDPLTEDGWPTEGTMRPLTSLMREKRRNTTPLKVFRGWKVAV